MKVTYKDTALVGLTDSIINVTAQKTAPKYKEPEVSTVEEATDHAKAYWMMGWTWDEIRTILEDMEYSAKTVSSAIKKTQEYAKECLKDGPFHIFKDGQLIRLKNGVVGKLESIHNDKLAVRLNDRSKILVKEGYVDMATSTKLAEAQRLREASHKLLADDYQYLSDEIEESESGYLLPTRKEKDRDVSIPEQEPKFTTHVTEKAPRGWGDITPYMGDVEDVSETVGNMLMEIEDLEQEMGDVKEELKIANEMAKEVRARQKELKGKEAEVAKNIFAILGSQNNVLDEVEFNVFQKYKDKLVGIRRKLEVTPQEIGPVEELEALHAILQENHPRVYKGVMSALNTYKETNSVILEEIEDMFGYYRPKEEKFKSPKSSKYAQVLESIKDWFADKWGMIKEVTQGLYSTVFPAVDETISVIDETIGNIETTAKKKVIFSGLGI